MFQLYRCLTVDHDWRLVALAAGVCLLSSAVAISLFHRAQAAQSPARLMWMALDGAAAGCGIWATHFIAMLAYDPAIGGRYNLLLTVLSLIIAMAMTGAGFGLALVDGRRTTCAVGGALVGFGIASMHYTGMLALEHSEFISWSPEIVAASILFGAVFGTAAVSFAVKGDSWTDTSISIGLLTLGIVAMHFTGMAAIENIPDLTSLQGSENLSPTLFSLFVAGATTLILGMCLVASLSDRRWKGTLQQQKMLLNTALENMSQGLAMFDSAGRVTLYNSRYATMTGLPAGPIKGRSLLELLRQRKETGHFDDDPEKHFVHVRSTMRNGQTNTRHVKVADRTLRIVEVPMKDGGWTATFEDVTEWLVTQAQISHMAHHDALTDLANRTLLIEKLRLSLAACPVTGECVALHFIDVDRFKNVNDTMGHDAGDLVLKALADRLRVLAGPKDIVARLGGDEFVFVQTGIGGSKDAEGFAQRIGAAVMAPITLNGQAIFTSVSIGVALAPADAVSPERLLKSADLAMYKSKADGRNCVRFFAPEMDEELRARTTLERTIRHALHNDGFVLHYQPLFDMANKRVIGFEALVRMAGEDGKLIQPMEFIPLAEELRLIDKIGAWVLNEACRTATTWPDYMTIAVNLSPLQFLNGDIGDIVGNVLASTGLAPRRLELEITENLLLGDTSTILEQLKRLKDMGVSIVMDDFGTGYSSLSYLWKFPFDKIKLDRSFMKGSGNAGRDAATVVKTIIALGRELNMRVTVEGVETASQAAFIEDVEGDQAQGYYFGRPVPASEIAAKILTNFQDQNADKPRAKTAKSGLKLVTTSGKK